MVVCRGTVDIFRCLRRNRKGPGFVYAPSLSANSGSGSVVILGQPNGPSAAPRIARILVAEGRSARLLPDDIGTVCPDNVGLVFDASLGSLTAQARVRDWAELHGIACTGSDRQALLSCGDLYGARRIWRTWDVPVVRGWPAQSPGQAEALFAALNGQAVARWSSADSLSQLSLIPDHPSALNALFRRAEAASGAILVEERPQARFVAYLLRGRMIGHQCYWIDSQPSQPRLPRRRPRGKTAPSVRVPLRRHLRTQSEKIFQAMACQGHGEVHFILDKQGRLKASHIDPSPDLRPSGALACVARHRGLTYRKLLLHIVAEAISR